MHSHPRLAFNVLVNFEDGLWVAHCLELDIVATGDSPKEAADDIRELIQAQVSSAMVNDNMDNLYHPAPREVWAAFTKARSLAAAKKTHRPPSVDASFYQRIIADALICHV